MCQASNAIIAKLYVTLTVEDELTYEDEKIKGYWRGPLSRVHWKFNERLFIAKRTLGFTVSIPTEYFVRESVQREAGLSFFFL